MGETEAALPMPCLQLGSLLVLQFANYYWAQHGVWMECSQPLQQNSSPIICSAQQNMVSSKNRISCVERDWHVLLGLGSGSPIWWEVCVSTTISATERIVCFLRCSTLLLIHYKIMWHLIRRLGLVQLKKPWMIGYSLLQIVVLRESGFVYVGWRMILRILPMVLLLLLCLMAKGKSPHLQLSICSYWSISWYSFQVYREFDMEQWLQFSFLCSRWIFFFR